MTSLSSDSQFYIDRASEQQVRSGSRASFTGSSPRCHSRGAAGTLSEPGLSGARLGSPRIIVAGQAAYAWLLDIHLRVIWGTLRSFTVSKNPHIVFPERL